MFNEHEPRGPNGEWIHLGLIHLGDLTTKDGRRSPEVSTEEFLAHAKRGAAKVAKMKAGRTAPTALVGNQWDQTVYSAWHATRKPWGGITVDAHTGKHVSPTADAYALTVRDPGTDSVHVDPEASREEFERAMKTARKRFAKILSRPGSHLGVFRDEDTNSIDIDPVLVTPSLDDVHDIGAYTHAVGGAYHFKSGDGYWPPHVKEDDTVKNLAFNTPAVHNETTDLAQQDGKLAFWKQILPMRSINYTAKDGSRQRIDFTKEYLTDLAKNRAVDKIGFLLADANNGHTMDPERWRGEVAELAVRDDGLYGKIVFPSAEAAKAVLDNPDLGVSARIREGVQKSDGRTIPRGIIHVLGTLDPQVEGMSPWQTADLSTQDDVLDLSDKEYEDMAKKSEPRDLSEFTEADIEQMTDEELDEFLTTYVPEFDVTSLTDEVEDADDEPSDEHKESEREPEKVGAELSTKTTSADIELANQQVASANARATEALKRVAEAEWREERNSYLGEGVPPHALDLAAPVLNRADDMVIDLSNSDEADVNVSEVVRGLLDALKGVVDLSNEEGHIGTFTTGEDPDKAILDQWDAQF